MTVALKEAALLRQGSANVQGDEQKSSQANLAGTSPQHRTKSSFHLIRARGVVGTVWKAGKSHTGEGLNCCCQKMVINALFSMENVWFCRVYCRLLPLDANLLQNLS